MDRAINFPDGLTLPQKRHYLIRLKKRLKIWHNGHPDRGKMSFFHGKLFPFTTAIRKAREELIEPAKTTIFSGLDAKTIWVGGKIEYPPTLDETDKQAVGLFLDVLRTELHTVPGIGDPIGWKDYHDKAKVIDDVLRSDATYEPDVEGSFK